MMSLESRRCEVREEETTIVIRWEVCEQEISYLPLELLCNLSIRCHFKSYRFLFFLLFFPGWSVYLQNSLCMPSSHYSTAKPLSSYLNVIIDVNNITLFTLNNLNYRHPEDLIVTPFAQILAGLRNVRNNLIQLTNVPLPQTRLVH